MRGVEQIPWLYDACCALFERFGLGRWRRWLVQGAAGRTLDVLVKVDVGFHRCGIDPDASRAGTFIKTVATMAGLRLRGLLSHAGQGYAATSEDELRAVAAREAGPARTSTPPALICKPS